jgi:Ca2+-binding RTX toxin-like protein
MAASASWYLLSSETNTVGLIAEGEPDYTINWGDGQVERVVASSGTSASAQHSYAADGVYRVVVSERPNDPAVAPEVLQAHVFTQATAGVASQGFAGDDVFLGGGFDDAFDGLGGDDLLLGDSGEDVLSGGLGADTLFGGDDRDHLIGDGGADLLAGGNGSDTLSGGAGYDTLVGNQGDDRLYAGGGGASLDGAEGADLLFGGSGADTFVLWEASESVVGDGDRVSRFTQGEDRFDFSRAFADGFVFIGSEAFSGAGAGEVRAVSGARTTNVYGDVDGDGVADFQITMAGVYDLQDADFGLIV